MIRSRSRLSRSTLALLVVILVPQPAFADWLLIPYVGIVIGGAPNTIDLDQFRHVFEQRFSFGGSLTSMGDGIFGLEVDLNYMPDFYQRTGGNRDFVFPALTRI